MALTRVQPACSGLAVILAACLALPATAQDRPDPNPGRPATGQAQPGDDAPVAGDEAAPPVGRPAPADGAGAAEDTGSAGEVSGDRPPRSRPDAPVSQGQLIPPGDMPPPAAPANAAPANPASQGRLIPPDEMPAPDAPAPGPGPRPDQAAGETPVEPPPGPPVPETLRESDLEFSACELGLFMLGARFTAEPAITDPADRDCGIARPVRVTEILPGIEIEGGADMRCDTARALARWMQQMVLPAASHLPGGPRLQSIIPGTTYQCRGVVGGASTSRLSEHATGNAIDIAGFNFAGGVTLPVEPRADRGDIVAAFQNTVQASACLFFTTVLGPGSNAAHDDHLHLDVKPRRGDFRLCQ